MPDDDDVDVEARLDQLGEAQVRLMVSAGSLPVHWHVPIVEWLAKKEKEKLHTTTTTTATG
jgi:hypothetical protein